MLISGNIYIHEGGNYGLFKTGSEREGGSCSNVAVLRRHALTSGCHPWTKFPIWRSRSSISFMGVQIEDGTGKRLDE